MNKKISIKIQDTETHLLNENFGDFISITDMANAKDNQSRAADIVKNWLRNRYTLEFLGTWEQLYNPNFKVVEFDHFKRHAGLNSFVLSVSEWIEKTNAVGMIVKKGRFGGTYAHKDIAFEFGSAISASFKLYLIKEFQRLKNDENNRLQLDWNIQRTLAKVNHHIHTDAIKENIIPNILSKSQIALVYANEADLINVALFGITAKQWRDANPNKEGNIRDMATIEQLVVLSNLESINAIFINQGLTQKNRLMQLNQIAISQMHSLLKHSNTLKKTNIK